MTPANIDTIVVVVKGEDDGEIVLDKAFRLARAAGAAINVLSIVHEDFADLTIHDSETQDEIRNFVRHSGESILTSLIEPLQNQGVVIESACIWNKYEWRGVLDVAETTGADLIIKSTEYPVHDVVRTPSDWNLLRHAEVPVMLVKPINWVESPVVLAAVDVTREEDRDLNKRILRRGAELATTLGGSLHVINTYPSVEHWVGPVTLVIDFDAVRKQVHDDIRRKTDALMAELEIDDAQVHTREGHVEEQLQLAAQETGAEIMVMGTHHRSGAKGMVLGNTSEKILHHVKTDVEVLR